MTKVTQKRFVVKLPAAVVAVLEKEAAYRCCTRNQLLLRIVRQHLLTGQQPLTDPPSPEALARLRPEQRDMVERRYQILAAWDQVRQRGALPRGIQKGSRRMLQRLAASEGRPVCLSTLYNWRRLFLWGGLPALVDGRGGRASTIRVPSAAAAKAPAGAQAGNGSNQEMKRVSVALA